MDVPMIGVGTDVHAFDSTRTCWVAGMKWHGEPGLAAHSDGDVACHAICDALLSAGGLGDLGTNYGTSRPEWTNASGISLIHETIRRVDTSGFRIVNVAVQVIGNHPRIGMRRDEAETTLTTAVGAPVRLSATTTDGLGLCGRSEGLASVAVAMVTAKQR